MRTNILLATALCVGALGTCSMPARAEISNADKKFLDALRRIGGADSADAAERAYIDAVGSDQAAIDSLLEKIAGNSIDADIKRFAADTSAAVKNHEDSAGNLAEH